MDIKQPRQKLAWVAATIWRWVWLDALAAEKAVDWWAWLGTAPVLVTGTRTRIAARKRRRDGLFGQKTRFGGDRCSFRTQIPAKSYRTHLQR